MPKPTETYKLLFSSGNDPDLTQVNEEASVGWELMQMSHREGSPNQWAYLMKRIVTTLAKDESP